MGTYLRVNERKALARAAAREVLATTPFHELTLRAVAERLGWPLGTLHRAYSVSTALLNDVLLEYEREAYAAVFKPGPGGLERELLAQAERWSDWLADPAHEQLQRYGVSLLCRQESPLAQDVPHARTSSQHYQKVLLGQIAAASGEAYRDPDALAALLAALLDGATHSFFEHGDVDRLRADQVAAVPLVVAQARIRVGTRRRVGVPVGG